MINETPVLAASDAERRAALALQRAITGRRTATIETFWSRPRWQLAQAGNLLVALAGSLISVGSAWVGAALVLVALISVITDWQLGLSPGRLLSGERASQNVVSGPPPYPARNPAGRGRGQTRSAPPVTLVVTATYDSPRVGLAQRVLPRSFGGFGWLAWLVVVLVWALATALARTDGSASTLLGILQLVPTVALVLSTLLLLELAIAPVAEVRTGAATALTLVRALDAAPPSNLAVELVLTGAGAGYGLGLRRHLRARRRTQDRTNTVVLGIGPDSDHAVSYLESDGPLLPRGFFRQLRQLAEPLAAAAAGHGCSAALPARMRGLPAIMLEGGSGSDRMQTALLLVDAIDAYVGELRADVAGPVRPA